MKTLLLRYLMVCSQDRIDHGTLIRWTKGFGSPNTEGHNVVEMFGRSLTKYVSYFVSCKELWWFDVLILVGCARQNRCLDLRYNRHIDRFSLRQSRHKDCVYFWNGMQRRLHGKRR